MEMFCFTPVDDEQPFWLFILELTIFLLSHFFFFFKFSFVPPLLNLISLGFQKFFFFFFLAVSSVNGQSVYEIPWLFLPSFPLFVQTVCQVSPVVSAVHPPVVKEWIQWKSGRNIYGALARKRRKNLKKKSRIWWFHAMKEEQWGRYVYAMLLGLCSFSYLSYLTRLYYRGYDIIFNNSLGLYSNM